MEEKRRKAKIRKRVVTPTCGGGIVPTITAVYEVQGSANWMDTGHYPKAAVFEVWMNYKHRKSK